MAASHTPADRANDHQNCRKFVPLSPIMTLAALAVAIAGYILAFSYPTTGPAILVALPALCLLARQRTAFGAFLLGLLVGFVVWATLLAFMNAIFGVFAIALWLLGATFYGIFLALLNLAHRRLGPTWALFLTPILWTGLEFFRSELWPLRFALLLPGHATALLPGVRLASFVGVYGLGFAYLFLAALAVGPNRFPRALGAVGLSLAGVLMYLPVLPTPEGKLNVAGVQMEFWDEAEVAAELDKLAASHPEAELLVLSEYTFSGPVPEIVRDVLRTHGKHLIAGGKRPAESGGYYNTAFVIGPDGSDVFEQGKSVPVQFMVDGLPAAERNVWDSPWGKLGIAICYDACFAEVMDDFVRQGARALIIPTMDVKEWGRFERAMIHGRAPPIRSAEYGIPSFGVWSSGHSQLIDRYGRIIATASYPGQGETIAGTLDLNHEGRVPPDRRLARASVAGTLLFMAFLPIQSVWMWWKSRRSPG